MNSDTENELTGKIAIVTGASRGLGAAIAEGLCNAGMIVYGIGRSQASIISHDNFSYTSCDVLDKASLTEIFKNVETAHDALSCLVNVAGITLPNTQGIMNDDAFDKTMAVNLKATHWIAQMAFANMKRQRRGSIVNITSIGGLMGFPNNPSYAASKGGLEALTRALAVDFGKCNVRVNNIAPGYFTTDMTAKSYLDEKMQQERSDRTILGRWGKPEELIGPTLFLASDKSSYVTGTTLVVDGGWTAKGL